MKKFNALLSFLIPFFLVLVIFPEIIFKNGSFRNLEIMSSPDRGPFKTVSVYEDPQRKVDFGLADYGGAAMQSEPMHYFLHHAFKNNESPYWNPYIGGGVPAVEGLVDMTFSLSSVLMAVFHPHTDNYHAIVLFTFLFGMIFLFKISQNYLKLGVFESTLICLFFILNGFHTANLNSNVIQPFLYLPALLFFSIRLAHQFTLRGFLYCAFATAISLSATFIPVLVLTLTFTACFLFFYLKDIAFQPKQRWKALGLVAGSWFFGFLGMAFLYFPIVDHLLHSDMLKVYSSRTFYPLNTEALISYFSPRHLWESYTEMASAFEKFGVGIFHVGISTSLVLFQLKIKSHFKTLRIFLLSLLLVTLCRVMDLKPISTLVSFIPFYGSIGSQYWWTTIICSYLFLLGLAAQDLKNRESLTPWSKFFIAGLFINIIALIKHYGLEQSSVLFDYQTYNPRRGVLHLLIIVFICYFGYKCIYKICENIGRRRNFYISSFILLVLVEFLFYMNHQRRERSEPILNAPKYIATLKEDAPNFRMINYGGEGLLPDLGAAYQIPQVETMTMSTSSSYYKFIDKFLMNPVDKWTTFIAFYKQAGDVKVNLDVLNFLGVKNILVNNNMDKYQKYFSEKLPLKLSADRLKIYSNPHALPKGFFVNTIVETDSVDFENAKLLSNSVFTTDEKLIVEAKSGGIQVVNKSNILNSLRPIKTSQKLDVLQNRHDYLKFSAHSAIPSVLVVSDTWHKNWVTYIDGNSVPTAKVNEAFRGVYVPAGEHKIEMKYENNSAKVGIVVSCLVALVSGLVLILSFVPLIANKFRFNN